VILLGLLETYAPEEGRKMTQASSENVTGLLLAWSDGDQAALEKLIPLVYAELYRLARHYMRGENAGHTLQTSALVNEAYLRLIDAHRVRWQNRGHFFAVSAQLMRRILVDFARARQSLKRGGSAHQVSLDEGLVVSPERGADLVALDEALERLGALNARQGRVVELRYFGGLTEEEVAEVLKVSPRTVRHDWTLARAWLYRELSLGGENDS
jgi:RNA polymerase sigma factor (TIGR02999 family)